MLCINSVCGSIHLVVYNINRIKLPDVTRPPGGDAAARWRRLRRSATATAAAARRLRRRLPGGRRCDHERRCRPRTSLPGGRWPPPPPTPRASGGEAECAAAAAAPLRRRLAPLPARRLRHTARGRSGCAWGGGGGGRETCARLVDNRAPNWRPITNKLQ